MSVFLPARFWPRAQRRFRRRFADDAGSLPGRPVHIRWFTSAGRKPRRDHLLANAPRWQDLTQIQVLAISAAGVLGAAWIVSAAVATLVVRLAVLGLVLAAMALVLAGPSVQSRRVGPGRRFVAVYRPDAMTRTPPTLVFEVDPSAFRSSPSGQGPAVFTGRLAPNAALCILAEGIAVWPTGPPVRRMPDAPGR